MTKAPAPSAKQRLKSVAGLVARSFVPTTESEVRKWAQDVTHYLRDTRVCDIDANGVDIVTRPFPKGKDSTVLTHVGVPTVFGNTFKNMIDRDGKLAALTELLSKRKADRTVWLNGEATLSTDVLKTLTDQKYGPDASLLAGVTALRPQTAPEPQEEAAPRATTPAAPQPRPIVYPEARIDPAQQAQNVSRQPTVRQQPGAGYYNQACGQLQYRDPTLARQPSLRAQQSFGYEQEHAQQQYRGIAPTRQPALRPQQSFYEQDDAQPQCASAPVTRQPSSRRPQQTVNDAQDGQYQAFQPAQRQPVVRPAHQVEQARTAPPAVQRSNPVAQQPVHPYAQPSHPGDERVGAPVQASSSKAAAAPNAAAGVELQELELEGMEMEQAELTLKLRELALKKEIHAKKLAIARAKAGLN